MIYILTFIIALVSQAYTSPTIQIIHSLEEVGWENFSEDSLVLFDIDEVVVTSNDIILKHSNNKKFAGWAQIPPDQFDYYLSIMLARTNYVLVDSKTPSIIYDLLNRGISVMGFTSCRTGKFGVIDSMEKWRFDQLKAVGVSFDPFFSDEFVFDDLVDVNSHPPLFKNGILFCGDFYHPMKSTKGELFGIFLDRIEGKPAQVIFIDDERKNLIAVGSELERRGISFQGYLLESDLSLLDEQVAYLQLKTLIKEKKWLSDVEAKNFILK